MWGRGNSLGGFSEDVMGNRDQCHQIRDFSPNPTATSAREGFSGYR
jgi:hypothetical protein